MEHVLVSLFLGPTAFLPLRDAAGKTSDLQHYLLPNGGTSIGRPTRMKNLANAWERCSR